MAIREDVKNPFAELFYFPFFLAECWDTEEEIEREEVRSHFKMR